MILPRTFQFFAFYVMLCYVPVLVLNSSSFPMSEQVEFVNTEYHVIFLCPLQNFLDIYIFLCFRLWQLHACSDLLPKDDRRLWLLLATGGRIQPYC